MNVQTIYKIGISTLMCIGLLATSLNAQDKKAGDEPHVVKKIKIVKIDEDGNKVVEVRTMDGENVMIFKGDDGEMIELDMKSLHEDMDWNEGHGGHGEGIIVMDKTVEIEDGEEVTITTKVKKDEDGVYRKYVTEERNGEIVNENVSEVDDIHSEMGHDMKFIKLSECTDGRKKRKGKNKKNCESQVIVIRHDGDGDMKWEGDLEDADLEEIMEKMNITIDLDIDEEIDGEHIVIKKRMIFVKIDDITDEDLEILNKAGEGQSSNEDKLELERMEFYPNPNNGLFTVDLKLDSDVPASLKVINMNGATVYEEKINSTSGIYKKEMDLSSQPAGVYFLSIAQGGKRVVKKVVLQ